MPDNSANLEGVLANYMKAVAEGNAPSRDELIAEHPQLAARLRAFFASYDATDAFEETSEPAPAAKPDSTENEDVTVAPSATFSVQPTPGSNKGGQIVGEYCLVRQLGQGGMGQVWEAESVDTGRRVAIKLLSSQLTPTQETLDRFLREAKTAAALSHPRSTFIFGAGEHHGQPYIVMELMPGETLQDVIDRDGALPINRAVDYILDALDGLEAAHRLNVIHRDVKPSNCFLDSEGRVKVGDFGLSKSLVSDVQLTQTGAFMGTPQYAAPEQIRGGEMDARTDIYSLGATLYTLIANRGPFSGDAVAVVAQIVSDPPTPLRTIVSKTPRSLERIIERTLLKDPARRYQELADLRQALLPFATGGTTSADLWRRLAGYTIDSLLMTITIGFFTLVLLVLLMILTTPLGSDLGTPAVWPNWERVAQTFAWFGTIAYFAIAESLWGRSVGKALMGLSVVDEAGEHASLWRCAMRALFVPGLLGTHLAANFVLTEAPSQYETQLGALTLKGTVVPALAWLYQTAFLLACMTTMRQANGYRGVHEWVSGTRVVRHKRQSERSRVAIPVLVPEQIIAAGEAPIPFGPYRVRGRLGSAGGRDVLLAQDQSLDRSVWIYSSADSTPSVDDSRRGIARSTRPYWLQGGQLDGKHWDALEAANGAPFPVFVKEVRPQWHVSRVVLADLASELDAGCSDGTLPTELSLEQVWVVAEGHVKLLDAPITPLDPGRTATSIDVPRPAHGDDGSATGLFRDAVTGCVDNEVLPDHVIEFTDELSRRPDSNETLTWASRQLAAMLHRPATLDWSHRLGCLTASLTTEGAGYVLLVLTVPSLVWLVARPSLPVWLVASLVVAAAIPATVGFGLRGGAVFRLMHVSVRNRKGDPASRFRCGIRAFAAWLPLMAVASVFGHMLAVWALESARTQLTPPPELAAFAFLGVSLLLVLSAVGAIFSVVSPQRALQDWFAGTQLVHR